MEKKRRKRRGKRLLAALSVFLVAAGAAGVIVFQVFTVKEVKVKGNEHYTDDQIEKFVLSDEHSWNSLYVVLKHRFFEVREVPFVDSMDISLDGPHALKVQVYEKGMIGYLYISAIGQYAYFDTDGFVVETSKERIEDIPQVEGLDCDKVVLYEKLPIEEEVLKNLLIATRSLQKNEVEPDTVLFSKDGDITLYYGEIQANLGSPDHLTQKILRLPYILPQLSGKQGVLHVENWDENTTDIIFDEIK